ncbi:uncharacterized protein H6S33_003042 [Morchella sextelata]|uniref:uncharacterized protein n=1 Tax=Morchella sextelata TaxID=1174677 RepID=UPI001D045AC9|nr:uncharacterized protein H6S33_003042 [Morchella sextelata]KAH0607054.1 hypothetical protein H6S33_003042 [Morchella sextelata]
MALLKPRSQSTLDSVRGGVLGSIMVLVKEMLVRGFVRANRENLTYPIAVTSLGSNYVLDKKHRLSSCHQRLHEYFQIEPRDWLGGLAGGPLMSIP